ncbi:hypothetical protein HY449_03770 [Candidatus Pacearchaeota archaeon]|nr:hypothetical protein [Candidatus Pacearchaeota archaeon]
MNSYGIFEAPGKKATLEEYDAGTINLDARTQFSPEHALYLGIYKVTLREPSQLSSKLFPLVVRLQEKKLGEHLFDVYSFDNNGICLSHGYSRYKCKEILVNEQHDLDVSRLVEHGRAIEDMISHFSIPFQLTVHPTFCDLRSNSLSR